MKFIDEIQIAGTALLLCGAMMVVSVVPKDKSIVTSQTPFKEAPRTAAEAQAQAEQEASEAGFTIYTQENNYDDSQSEQINYDQDSSGDYEDNQDPSGDIDNGDVPGDTEGDGEDVPQDQPQDVEGEISPDQPQDTGEEAEPEENGDITE